MLDSPNLPFWKVSDKLRCEIKTPQVALPCFKTSCAAPPLNLTRPRALMARPTRFFTAKHGESLRRKKNLRMVVPHPSR
ncbi:hypothetical protein TWF106_008345 [Orbilia oligospora]|uniref:Uncharacterized protein n=1 Tax=Orbilia oligospora TaxID=2813651 RepID=A0A7C8QYK6_ORBOL|nr:hypothetical protein TWF106_008345 [Orbilia oligospora]